MRHDRGKRLDGVSATRQLDFLRGRRNKRLHGGSATRQLGFLPREKKPITGNPPRFSIPSNTAQPRCKPLRRPATASSRPLRIPTRSCHRPSRPDSCRHEQPPSPALPTTNAAEAARTRRRDASSASNSPNNLACLPWQLSHYGHCDPGTCPIEGSRIQTSHISGRNATAVSHLYRGPRARLVDTHDRSYQEV